jgi:hypothetical protein
MKNSLLHIAAVLGILLMATSAKANFFSRAKYDSLACLQIEGIVKNANDNTDSECIVELISSNEIIDTVILKEGKKKFKFVLKKDTYYAIRVSKKGYISKIVSVNTEIINSGFGMYVFQFETTLLKDALLCRLNKDILDFPIAIIHFDYEKDCFSYNKEYSAYIKREMYNVKPSYQKSHKKETLAPLASAIN